MTRPIPPALLAALTSRTTTLCLCWQAVRTDGTIYGFTDHDVNVIFDAGDGNGTVLYMASSSFVGSDIQDQLGLAVSNMDLMGALQSDAVTDADLEDGRWDEAVITIFAVDYTNPANANTVMVSGTVGQVTAGDLAFQAELRSLGQHFAQYIGALLQPTCRSQMFDTGKGVDGGCNFPKPPAVASTVTAQTSRTSFTVSAVGSFPTGTRGSLSGGYFAFGTATGTSGANNGISREIFTSDTDINITTFLPFPEDIAIGDTFDLQFGCDKTLEVCRDNFDNLINIRCEPYVPGTDFVFRVNGEQ